ncbi:cyclin-D5-1 [Ricinus communis]|uniref:cyclin-D5-1 n=1 Tax=Ricinus communis TaxID=3988 RepID=UPI00201AC623|nr:cyclin-D5-1 [Ricinus communis]
MADFDNSLSLSSLLCQEDDASCFNENNSFQELNFESSSSSSSSCFVLENEEIEYIEKMVEMESRSFTCSDDSSFANYSWLRCARLDAIDWIFNTRAIFGFRFHTAYLSVTYFDRFLSKRSIDDGKLWAIRLLSVACLSLAAKMEECRVPPLSEFPIEDYCFENKVIQRMELLVLNTLEWKMGSITPFSYLHYFINKICGESRQKETVSRAGELIVAVIKEINLLDHRPSIIAMAAVLAASDNQLTRQELELKMKVISSWGSLQNEHIFSCYIVMQEIEMGKLKTPKQVISPNSSSIHSTSMALLENSSSTTFGAGTKRRLTYNDCDQNCPVKKICHQP